MEENQFKTVNKQGSQPAKVTRKMQPLLIATLPLQGRHLIEASAGTGKTYSIVRIYLRLLLEQEYRVEQILLVTFTVAATAELRHRLDAFLRDCLHSWDTSDDEIIAAIRQSGQVSGSRAKLLLQRAILQLDEAAIFTIHSFCKRALAQQAFTSGMSFQASLDADSNLLAIEATRDWYRHIQSRQDYPDIADRWPTPESFYQEWQQLIDSTASMKKPDTVDMDSLLLSFREQWALEREVFVAKNKRNARTAADTAVAYDGLLEKLDSIEAGGSLPDFTGTELSRCFSTATKKENMPSAFALVSGSLQQLRIQQIRYAIKGVEYIRQHIARNKLRLDQMHFDDLINLLKNALTGSNSHTLANELRQQFPAAMVDEFQDTDPDQYAILKAIYGSANTHFLCLIGDPKQAIYGFRGGDVFAYLKAREDADYQWTMNINYRSSPPLVAGYNQLFLQGESDINQQVFGFGIDYRKVMADDCIAAPVFSDQAHRCPLQWVEILADDDELNRKGLNKSYQQRIAEWIAAEIVTLLNTVSRDGGTIPTGDIAVLVRSGAEAGVIQEAMTRLGLPSVYLSAKENIFQTDQARDLLRLLRGIWHLEDDGSFISALASLWIGLDYRQLQLVVNDENHWSVWQQRFEGWRNQWQRVGLMSVLLDCLKHHCQLPAESNRDRLLTNCLHLAERLQEANSRYRSPDALLQWLQQSMDEVSGADENRLRLESDAAMIKVSTLHGAKGLEYPIVFLPFISYHSRSNQVPLSRRYHDRSTFELHTVFLPDNVQKQWSEEEEAAEQVRLTYVAATRAKQRLYCCMAPFSSFAGSALATTLKLSAYDHHVIRDKVCPDSAIGVLTVREAAIEFPVWSPDTAEVDLKAAVFDGRIERDWWLSSFSALTRHLSHTHLDQRDGEEVAADDLTPDSDAIPGPDLLPLRFRMAKGAEAGNLLHDALEHCDFSSPDYDGIWQRAKLRYGGLLNDRTEWQTWLQEIMAAPIGDTCLQELSRDNTLREAEFYFPMAGADISSLSSFIARRRGQDYQLPSHHRLKGMMHGFIDLIFTAANRFYVVDYKSTHLGNDYAHYTSAQLAETNINHSYDLQYCLYALALHRYLKSRLPDYAVDQHFGGVYYLYLRGMHPQHHTGVFFDRLSADELDELDGLFGLSSPQEAV